VIKVEKKNEQKEENFSTISSWATQNGSGGERTNKEETEEGKRARGVEEKKCRFIW